MHISTAHKLAGDVCWKGLLKRVKEGDAEALVELAVRIPAGCGSEYSLDAGVEFIDHLVRPDESTFTNILPMAPSEQLFRHLYRSVFNANAVVERGLHCQTAFRIAEEVLDLGRLNRQNVRGGARFRWFKVLWAVYDRYKQVLEKQELTPSRYACAAAYCSFKTMKGKQLKQCAGGCPPQLKPSYCSKECQRKDWVRQKAICVKTRVVDGSTLSQ
ncbi:hypothetical protein C8Q80DRAFT_1276513 [Daedaleopsis nitida]|nr:hypothetical protein C8Q80DRAFT_1276513 [Daedaleopsis nitida]